MDREHLPDRSPSFSELRASHTQNDPNSNRNMAENLLNELDSLGVPLVSLLPRLLLVGLDHAAKKKKVEILRVCGRLQELHAHAVRVTDSDEQLLGEKWVSKYQDLVLRFTAFAQQYEKKRRVLLRITRRVKSDDDAQALGDFHREIDNLYFELP